MDQLGLPEGDDVPGAARRRDRLFVMLVADLLRFELAAADGTTDLLESSVRRRAADRQALPALARAGGAALAGASRPSPVDATEAGGLDAAPREVCGADPGH